ncbi:hypothetical protein Scep_001945 [Stephania cephalantha]|uniref:Uncharacterized protein n=1 Tax=Stephania cephalantha TaxID=152367 RepID=A0AAP0LD07_9MAGN
MGRNRLKTRRQYGSRRRAHPEARKKGLVIVRVSVYWTRIGSKGFEGEKEGLEREKNRRQNREKRRMRKNMRKNMKLRKKGHVINWDPYVDIRVDDDDITESAFYMRTFMFLSIVEPHLDTFLRQMGYVQRILLPLYKPTRISYLSIENPEYNVGDNFEDDDLFNHVRQAMDIVHKWKVLLSSESNKTSAEKMADDVLRHMTGKGSSTSATVASGGREPSRTFHHDSSSTQSDYHTFADDPDPSKRKKRNTNHHKKKRTKANK